MHCLLESKSKPRKTKLARNAGWVTRKTLAPEWPDPVYQGMRLTANDGYYYRRLPRKSSVI
jgi:hypothetical protein